MTIFSCVIVAFYLHCFVYTKKNGQLPISQLAKTKSSRASWLFYVWVDFLEVDHSSKYSFVASNGLKNHFLRVLSFF